MIGAIAALAQPISPALAPAGFVSGPKILKTVGIPSCFLAGAAKRIAGWWRGAKQNAIPASRAI